jgi:hypothetical protein
VRESLYYGRPQPGAHDMSENKERKNVGKRERKKKIQE